MNQRKPHRAARTPAFLIEPLEERVLLSATPVAGLPLGHAHLHPVVVETAPAALPALANAAAHATATGGLFDQVELSAIPAAAVQTPAVQIEQGATAEFGQPGTDGRGNASSEVNLSQADLDAAGAAGPLVLGGETLQDLLIIGQNGQQAVHLPVTTLRGTQIVFQSPTFAQSLTIIGDGSTVDLTTNLTSATDVVINDSVKVTGDRSITAQAGQVRIAAPGTIYGDGDLAPDSLTLSATTDVLIDGAIGAAAGLQNLTINSGGNVTLNGAVTLGGNLTVNTGQAVVFNGALTITGDLTLDNVQSVTFNGPVTVTGKVVINKATSVNFNGNVAVGGNVTVGSSSAYANIGAVVFTTSARLDFGGAASFYSSGAITFGNAIGRSLTLTPQSLTLGSNDAITFASAAEVKLGTAPLSIVAGTTVSFGNNVVAGALSVSPVSGNIDFQGTTQVNSLTLVTTGASALARLNFLEVGSGDAVITANQIDFIGTVTDTGAASNLTLKPYTTGRAIAIGSSILSTPGYTIPLFSNRLDLSGNDMLAIQAGFASVNIGDAAAGTGIVYLGFMGTQLSGVSAEYLNRTQIYGGTIVVTQPMDIGATVDYFRLVARTGDVVINALVGYAQNGSLSERSPWLRFEAAANVVINQPIYATDRISLSAGMNSAGFVGSGSGSVTVAATGSVMTSNAAGPNKRIELSAGPLGGDILLFGASAEATILSTAGSSSEIALYAKAGAVTQSSGRIVGDRLAMQSANNITVRTNVGSLTAMTINGAVLPAGADQAINGVLITGAGTFTQTEVNNLAVDQVTTNGGAVAITTESGGAGNIVVNNINTVSGAITLTADGAITDSTPASDASVNLQTTGLLTATAKNGIGAAGLADLDVTIGSLQATNSVSGGIYLANQGNAGTTITGTGVRTTGGNGPISVTVTTGNLTISAPVAADGSGSVQLITAGASGSITSSAATSSATGPILLQSVNNITLNSGGTVATGGAGTIDLEAQNGSIALSAAATASGSGNIRFNAVNAGNTANIILSAAVATSTGSITILATNSVTQNSGANLTSIGSGSTGTIDVEATTGSITMAANALTATTGGNIRYKANVDATLGVLDARTNADRAGSTLIDQAAIWGSVSVLAVTGQIVDAKTAVATEPNIYARGIRLNANTRIGIDGASANPLEIEGAVLSAYAAGTSTSGINLLESTDITVDTVAVSVNRVAADLSASVAPATTDAAQSDLITAANNGHILLLTLDGSITVNAGTAPAGGIGVSANGAGNVLLAAGQTGATARDVSLNAAVQSATGNLSVIAAGSVNQNLVSATVKGDLVTAGTGTIDVQATTGSIVMAVNGADTTLAQTVGQNIRYSAGDSVMLARLDARDATNRADALLTNQAAGWGDISVTAGTVVSTGGITDAKVAGDAAVNLYANNLRLTAAANVGTLGAGTSNALETEVANLAARGAAGGINLLDNSDVTVGTIGQVPAARVAATGITSTQQDAAGLSDLATTGGDGSIVLRTVDGSITLTDGIAPADVTAVSAAGTGNILIEAQGAGRDVIANAAVKSVAGNITLKARHTVALNANGHLETGSAAGIAGTINVESVDLDIDMAAGVHAQTDGGNVRLHAGRHVVLGVVDARIASDRTGATLTLQNDATTPWGDVSVTAGATDAAGYITDADALNDTAVNVFARGLRLMAATRIGESTGVGAGYNPVETEVAVLSALAANGNIMLIESTDVTIGAVAVSVNAVAVDGVAATLADASQADLTTTGGNGSIILLTNNGNLTLTDGDANNVAISANGSGNIYLDAGVAGGASVGGISLLANAAVQTASGSILLISHVTDISFAAAANLIVSASPGGVAGSIVVAAQRSVLMDPAATFQTNAANIAVYSYTGDIVTGLVDARTNADRLGGTLSDQATWGQIVLDTTAIGATTGSIRDAKSDAASTTVNLYASAARLRAGNAIGALGVGTDNALETEVITLAAQTIGGGGGGINLRDLTSVTVGLVGDIGLTNIFFGNTTALYTDTTALSELTTAGNGSIVLRTVNGTITLTDADGDGMAVAADGSGNVRLEAGGASSDVVVNARVTSASGNLSLQAGHSVIQSNAGTGIADLVVATAPGSIDVEAVTGSITMDSDRQAVTAGGSIRYAAGTDVILGVLDARTVADRVGGTLADQTSATTPWGDVSVLAGTFGASPTGSILDAKAPASGTENVFARWLRLHAATRIGNLAVDGNLNALETEVAVVTAYAAAGGISLRDDTDVTVDTVTVTVSRVLADGSTTAQTDLQQADLVTAGADGSISLTASNGSITVNDGADAATGGLALVGISANGAGNIFLQASGAAHDITLGVGAAIQSGTGNITLIAARDITQQAGGNIVVIASTGTIDIGATAGSITMDPAASDQTDGANIRLDAGTSIIAGVIDARTNADRLGGTLTQQAAWGSLALSAGSGSITDAKARGEAGINLYGSSARLSAATDIGVLGAGVDNALDTELVTVAAETTTAGSINLADASDLTVDTVAIIYVNRVAADGTASVIGTTALSDLTTTGNGAIVVTAAGDLTLNDGFANNTAVSANGTGNVYVSAANVTANADILSGSGDITLLGTTNLTFNTTADVKTSGGDVNLVAAAGAILFADNAQVATSNGNVRLLAATDITLGGIQAGTGSVTLTAIAGSILDGGDTYQDISASAARLVAGTGIGTSTNPLEVGLDTLAASAGSAGISLVEDNALTVTNVSITVRSVATDASSAALAAETLSDLTTTANGSIALTIIAGDLTLNDGFANNTAVSANGSGNVYFSAANVTANADILSGSGDITLLGATNLAFNATADVKTTGGDVNLVAGVGAILFADNAQIATSGGNVRLLAATDITLGGLQAGTGSVTLTATAGSILDGGDTYQDISASAARLVAGTGIGTSTNPLEVSLDTLAASAGSAGISLLEDNALTITNVSVTVRAVAADFTSTALAAETLSDLTTTANGSIALTIIAGDLTLNDGFVNNTAVSANGTGNIYFSAANLTANADILSGSGDITLLGATNLTFTTTADVKTTGGDVNLVAAAGAIHFADNAQVATSNGNVRLLAATDITLGGIQAGTGSVTLTATAGSILDGGDTYQDISASAARLVAGTGIGTATNPLEVGLDTLAASAGSAGISLLEDNALTITNVSVTVRAVAADFTSTALTAETLSDLTTTANGSIALTIIAGDLTLNDGFVNNTAVSANGTGNVYFSAANLTANADILSGSGDITLLGATNLTFNTTADIKTTGGDVNLVATAGAIHFADNAQIATSGGNVRFLAATDITLGGIQAGTGSVTLTATAGSILDGGDTYQDISASAARLVAGTGIGTATNPLEVGLDTLAASAGSAGISLLEDNALTITNVSITVRAVAADFISTALTAETLSDLVTTANGSIALTIIAGDLTLNDGFANNTAVSANGSGNVYVSAANVTANADILSGSGDITLLGATNLTFNPTADVKTSGGDVNLVATAGAIHFADNAQIATSGGNVRLLAASDITLGGLQAGTGSVTLTAIAGSILDGGDTYQDISASAARLVAGTGIGTATNPLEVGLDTLAASAGSAGISLLEDNALTITNVSVTVRSVATDASSAALAAETLSDLTTTANGSIALTIIAGDLTLNDGFANNTAVSANGSGNVYFSAANVTANADILSGSGDITLLGATNLAFNATADVKTTGGDVNLVAGVGAILFADNAQIATSGGNVRLLAATDITLGGLQAGTGSVTLTATAGSILDGGDTYQDISASAARLVAGTGIGTATNPLEVGLDTLAASAGSAGISLLEDNALTITNVSVTVRAVAADFTSTALTAETLSDLVTTANGSIALTIIAGDLTLNDGFVNNTAVSANGTGNVYFSAANVTANADILSGSGDITLLGATNLTFTTTADVKTTGGDVNLVAAAGAIHFADNAQVATSNGNVRLLAATDITLGGLQAGTGSVTLTATAGSILDGGDTYQDISASAARLVAGTGIGTSTNPLEVGLDTLAASAGSAGISLLEDNALTITNVSVTVRAVAADFTSTALAAETLSDLTTTANGSIALTIIAGDLTLNDGFANNTAVSANGSGNVYFSAANVTANADILSGSGDITLLGATNLTFNATADIKTSGGDVNLVATAGAIHFADNAQIATSGGNVRLLAATDITLGGLQAGTGSVTLTATAGSILDGGDTYQDISASAARLVAGTGIGTATNPLEVGLDTLAASAGSAGISLLEDNALTIANVSVTVRAVAADFTSTALTAETLSDLTTTANGSIALTIIGGDLTLNDGFANNTAVSANGSGNVYFSAANLTANADILSGSGDITLLGATNLTFNATADVKTSGGDVNLVASAGAIHFADNAQVATSNGNVRLLAATDITLGGIQAGTGSVTLTATAGSILDGGDTYQDISASAARLVAGTGIGTSTNPLEVGLDTLAASAGSAGISLLEDNALKITNVSVTVRAVAADVTSTALAAETLSDLTTTANGSIALTIIAGDLTLNDGFVNNTAVSANGSGNVYFSAANVTANADILSGSGDITLLGATNLTFNATADIKTTGGDVNLVATAGAIHFADNAQIATSGGNVRLLAATDITLGGIQAGTGSVTLTATAGSILDGGDTYQDISASAARLVAGTGIGTSTNPLEVGLDTLAASAGSAGISLLEDNALTITNVSVTVRAVAADFTSAALAAETLSDLVTTANGSIALTIIAGDLTLNDGFVNNTAVSANGSGNVYFSAANLTANADILSGSGDITLLGATNLTFNATADVKTTGGDVNLVASAGAIHFADNAQVATSGGNVRLLAATDITLGGLQAGTGSVTLTATAGSILDGGDTYQDISASAARLVAGTGIGTSTNPLEVGLDTLAASAGSAGISLLEDNALTITNVSVTVRAVAADFTSAALTAETLSDLTTTANGSIALRTLNGTLTLNDGGNANHTAVSAAGTGRILLSAGGATSDLLLNADVISATGAITLLAGHDLTTAATVAVQTAGDLDLEATTGALTLAATSTLTTTAGSLRLLAGADVRLAQVRATTGRILIRSGASILDNTAGTAAANLTATAVRLEAGTGAGTAATPLTLATALLAGTAGSGGLNILNATALTIDTVTFALAKVNANFTTTTVTEPSLADLTTTANGAITLRTANGTLTLNDGADADGLALSAAGTGAITLLPGGAASNLQVNAGVRSGTGPILLDAPAAITLSSAATIATTGGTLTLHTATGAITMDSGSRLASAGGLLTVTAAQRLAVSIIDAGTGAMVLTTGADLTDNLATEAPNLLGAAATLRSVGSLGTAANNLNTTLGTLDAAISGPGTLVLADTGNLTVTATTTDGAITLTTAGTLTATALTAGGTADITLTAGADLLVGTVLAENDTITATAAGRLERASTGTQFTAALLTLQAGTGIGTLDPVVVAVPTLSATSTTGDIRLRNLLTTDVTVTHLATGTGAIAYSQAGGTLLVTDATTQDGDIALSLDQGNLHVVNVDAGGTGDISLTVIGTGKVKYDTAHAGGGDLNISTSGAVTLDEDLVTHGENLHFTGNVVLPRDTLITTFGGDVTFDQTIDGAYALTIDAGSGDVSFAQALGAQTPLTQLTITTTGALTFAATVTVQGDLVLGSGSLTLTGGPGSIHTLNHGQFIAAPATNVATIGLGNVPTPSAYAYLLSQTSLEALAPGFSQVVLGRADSSARIDLGTVTLVNPTLIRSPQATGTIVLLANQTLTVTGANPLTLQAGPGTGAFTQETGAKLLAGTGLVTITADLLNLQGAAGSITGTGRLILQPASLTQPITVGQAGGFDLLAPEIAVPAAFTEVQIGRTDGAHAIDVYQSTFGTAVLFSAPAAAGTLTVHGAVRTSGAQGNLTARTGGDLTIDANLTIGISGTLTLTADTDGDNHGAVRIAQNAVSVLQVAQGGIVLQGEAIQIGTATNRAELLALQGAITLTVDLNANGQGTLTLANDNTQLKAGTDLLITTGGTAPVTGTLTLRGQLQALGRITVRSAADVVAQNLLLTALGAISLTSAGNVTLQSTILQTPAGALTLSADSDHNGTGDLTLGAAAPVLVTAQLDLVLGGENVTIGGLGANFGRVNSLAGAVSIFANYNRDTTGRFMLIQALSEVNAATTLQVGDLLFGAGTPVEIILNEGALRSKGTLLVQTTGNLAIGIGTIAGQANVEFSAYGDITVTQGSLLSSGNRLALMADFERDNHGTLTIAANVSLSVPNGNLLLFGYDVLLDPSAKTSAATFTLTRWKG
ncbi:hypothetical protein K0B96_00005 [Horticoccus luteus]|uniref:Uncharacterized protein n=1 Tax=Horticoccus luteus TaxID=2862869 RepID=A0A8F9TZR3_9BACT|nr:hypothetical protein [Horticoccus luteus]QYM80869.1 hypothetical protein K0B96_00005 [Horticoccus luteus]